GYLLESEISKVLSKNGFFIQTNQMIKDPITSKNREIDLIAEYHEYQEARRTDKCCAKIHFVFEIKNTSAPIVLLTNFQFTPNMENWLGLKERITRPQNSSCITYDAFYERLIHNENPSIYAQY